MKRKWIWNFIQLAMKQEMETLKRECHVFADCCYCLYICYYLYILCELKNKGWTDIISIAMFYRTSRMQIVFWVKSLVFCWRCSFFMHRGNKYRNKETDQENTVDMIMYLKLDDQIELSKQSKNHEAVCCFEVNSI